MTLTFSEVGPPPRDELPLSVLNEVQRRGSSMSVDKKCKEKELNLQNVLNSVSTSAAYHLMK